MTVEEILNSIEAKPKDELSEHEAVWHDLLATANSVDCAYERKGYIFIGLPLTKNLLGLIDYDLMTDKSIPLTKEVSLDKLEGVLIMYDVIENDGLPVITAQSPSAFVPENARDKIFDMLISLYEEHGYTTDSLTILTDED